MIPNEYDIGDLMEITDEEYDRGLEVRSGLSISMPCEDDDGNQVWVAAGRGSVNMRRRTGQDSCWWVSVCEKEPDAMGWGQEEVRMTKDVDEPNDLHELLEDMGVSDYGVHRAIRMWLWG
jgi:hypothetical protein